MYRRLSAFLFPVFAVILAGALVWGYQVNQEKNSILIKAENNYQRAFHDLSYHMDHLHAELGNALAVHSTSQGFHRKCLVNVWRLTSQAQNEISQLPLTLLPFHKTEEFLSKISRFSYQTAVRDLNREPLTPQEMKTLEALHQRSKEISRELQRVQEQVIGKNLRWMDVEMALASEESQMDNAIIDGFKTVNKNVTEYDEVNWGPSMAAVFEKKDVTKLSGKTFGAEEIVRKARQFFGLDESVPVRVVENGEGTDYQTFSVTAETKQGRLQMDYTKKGGHLIWYMNNRQTGPRQLSANQAVQKAKTFLKKHGFGEMEPVNYNEYENVAHVTLARVKDNVLVYPQKLAVKVALDRGDAVGLQASDYILSQGERKWEKPQMTAAEAKKRLNPDFEVQGQRLAVIENDLKKEVLCYQFSGRINGSLYRIYLNADTGLEEKVEQVRQSHLGA